VQLEGDEPIGLCWSAGIVFFGKNPDNLISTKTTFLDDGPASRLVIKHSSARYNVSFPDCIAACVSITLKNDATMHPYRDSDFANLSTKLYQAWNLASMHKNN
jgi:hypothetical protein